MSDDRTAVILLTGPPGAGKSTVAAGLARRYPRAAHLHTDDFWHYLVSGLIPPYEPAAHEQNETVLGVIAAAAFGYVAGNITTVVDGIVGPWMLRHFRGRPGVPVHYLVLRPDRATVLARATARTAPGALVDPGPIAAMWDQFADLGDLERHVLDTSAEDPAATEQRVADAVESGRLLLG